MKSISKIICCTILLSVVFIANGQRKITATGIKDLRVTNIDSDNMINNKLRYTITNPVRCMIDVNGVNSSSALFDFKAIRYNTGGSIVIDLNTETITFKKAGLYHLEGSFYTFFMDNDPHEILLNAKINGEKLEPLDFKTTPLNNVGFSSTGLKFQNDIYLAAGTTFQLSVDGVAMKNVRGFFSANYISP